MRKFLTVSVCLFVSLMANANVSVTRSADGLADSITISGSLTEEEVQAARNQLTFSSVKIATGNYVLTQDDWNKIIPSGELIIDKVRNLDLSDARFEQAFLNKNNFGYMIGNRNIKYVTLSRYNDIPYQCFNSNNSIESITIPNRKEGDESITIGEEAFSAMSKLTTLYIGNCVTRIGPGMCRCSSKGQSRLISITFNTPEITELPAASFQNCDALKRIDLPTNLQEVGEGAFEFCSLETIAFPITLTTIRKNAFHDCNLTYVVIPKNVTLIETEAFQSNSNLTDVYIMGDNVKCQENGFSKQQNCEGFKNDITGYTKEEPASREDWTKNNNSNLSPVVLHFIASETNSHTIYENPYYTMLNTEGILDILKACDTKEKKDQFVSTYNLYNGFPWSLYYYANNNNCKCPFAYYTYKDNSGKEKTCKIWREENGYYSPIGIKEISEDYAGWKQFLIIQDDAKQNTYEDEHRIDDRWYSMCFPFDLNAKQIRTAYGAGTEVCEFIGVWNTHEKNEDGDEIVTFRYKPLLEDVEEESNARVSEPIITKANHAYMIHPASKKEGDNTNVWYRIIPGIPMDMQQGVQSNLIPTRPEFDFDQETMSKFDDGESTLIKGFEFIGNYAANKKLPADSYYFAYRDYADGSRSLILNHLTKESKHDWTPMTALVRPFAEGVSMASFSKKFSFTFSTEKDDDTTGILEVNAERMNHNKVNSQKTYNLNGQLVKGDIHTNSLNKGIYIVNGKKYVVK